MASISLGEREMSRSIASLEDEFWDNYYFLIKEFNCNLVRGQMRITQWPSKYFIISFEALGEEAPRYIQILLLRTAWLFPSSPLSAAFKKQQLKSLYCVEGRNMLI